MTVYFISGLGADERVFQRLVLPNEWESIHIKWPIIEPKETLQSFSKKIAQQINISQPFAVVGCSFGGIVATELKALLPPHQTIIISSVSVRKELPLSYKLLGALRINKIVPKHFLNKVYPFTYWYFGLQNSSDQQLLKQIMLDTPTHFLKWATHEIIHWKNNNRPEKLFHIHGNGDRIFPPAGLKIDYTIPDAGHFMIHTHAAEVSKVLREQINNTD